MATLQTSKSNIEIKSTQNNTEKYYSYNHGLKFHMSGEPLLQMIHNNSGSPVLSMRGRSIIDFDNVYYSGSSPITAKRINKDYWLSPTAANYYSNVDSPFVSGKKLYDDGLIYPLVQIKESSTVLMEGSPFIHISGGASLLMDGNADIRIRGAGYYDSDKGGAAKGAPNAGKTFFIVDPGSVFTMQTNSNNQQQHRPIFQMNAGENPVKGQIILSCQGKIQTNDYPHFSNEVFDQIYYPRHIYPDFNCQNLPFVRNKINSNPKRTDDILKNIQQPTLIIEGRTHITLGDTGYLGAKIATLGALQVNVGGNSGSSVSIKAGPDSGAIETYEFCCGKNAKQAIKFGTNENGNTTIAFEPHGITSLKFSPEQVCGISYTPKYTDIVCQWEKFEGIFEGEDVFIQHEGNGHFEFLNDSTVIMRGPLNRNQSSSEVKISSNGPAITIITQTDYTEYSFNAISDSDRKKIEELMNPSFSSIGKHYYDGGEIISTEYYPDRYTIVVEGGVASNVYITLWSTKYYTASEFVQSNEFKTYIESNYGPNVTVVNNSSFDYGYDSSWREYRYSIKVTLSDIREQFNSENEYSINTIFSDLSESDQAKLNSSISHTNSKVINVFVRKDMKYNTTFSNYRYITGIHLGKDWTLPIQNENGPVSQMYDLSNFCMRGQNPINALVYTYILENPIKIYDFSQSQYDLITGFINSEDYITFLNSIEPASGTEFSEIIKISDNEGSLFIEYRTKKIGKSNSVIQQNDSPVFEAIGRSELRLNGASIKAETKWDKTFITFKGAKNEEVVFSLDELKALKQLLSN